MGQDAFGPFRREVGSDKRHNEDDDGEQEEYLDRVINEEFQGTGEPALFHANERIDDVVYECLEHLDPQHIKYFLYISGGGGKCQAEFQRFGWSIRLLIPSVVKTFPCSSTMIASAPSFRTI